jgi:FkbH-like protein
VRKESGSAEALRLLRDALRRGQLGPEEVERAGRLIGKEIKGLPADRIQARVRFLGQYTTSWVATSLIATAWGRGAAVQVTEGGYDNVLQELMAPPSEHRADVIVLLPWTQRLFSGGDRRSPQERVMDELGFWKQTWQLVGQRHSARILQVGYDSMTPGALGCHLGGGDGEVGLVRRANLALREHLPPSAYFLDLEQVAGAMGRERFYDSRRYFWTKQPFSEAGALRLAEHVWAGVRALMTGPKKVLVLDLDNTLWGGVVGETGPLGVALGESPDGEAYRAFQQHAKELARRGVVLAVCSKNNPADARGPFEQNPSMVLALSDFAHFDASWDPKALGLRRIADTLRLGLDSFVFFDDNPAEREHIRQALPDVEVVEVPEDPAGYVPALQAGLWFEAVALSEADAQRSLQYQQEAQRRTEQEAFASMDDYLRSLDMRGDVRAVDDGDLARVVQLIGKTNQFNLTTRRHGTEDVLGLLRSPRSVGMTLRVTDRFGDHGLIAVLLAAPAAEDDTVLRIDTWLMSCRVIGRTVEEFFFNTLLARARDLGYAEIEGEFIPTPKNSLVADLYERLGFARAAATADGGVSYRLAVPATPPAVTFVQASA